MNIFILSVLLGLITLTKWSRSQSNDDEIELQKMLGLTLNQEILIRDFIFKLVGGTSMDENNLRIARKRNKLQCPLRTFPCSTTGFRSSVRPNSVHKLRPGDIDVIGAIGDSLTAGNGLAATNLLQLAIENRGISWSIGGQGNWSEYFTLPNILKVFNPNLVGYALGDARSHHKDSQFNVGEPGAMGKDMPFMVKELVKRIKNDKRVHFREDWKLITYMIGSNDFCTEICYMRDPYKALEIYRNNLIFVIEYLKKNLPRTLLQIVSTPNLKNLVDMVGIPAICNIVHRLECPCLVGLPFKKLKPDILKIMRKWQNIESELASDPKYTTDDFAVVNQLFTYNIVYPTTNRNGKTVTDTTYSSEDCFHFSQKAYARAANALWNNMLEPVGMKSVDWNKEFTRILCPTDENPYIFTNVNSLNIL